MKLSELLRGLDTLEIMGNNNLSIDNISFDSRKITKNSLFISAKGIENDGHDFIDKAIEFGAMAVVHENNLQKKLPHITYIRVPDSRKAIGLIAQNFYGHPSRYLKLIGVTGTNGKTTIATLLFRLFRELGYHTALISTVENKIDETIYLTDHTTPDSLTLTAFLKKAADAGVQYAFMECSSHGITEERISGLEFAGGIFTNITLDHLDYHGTFEKYAEAKKKFFDELPKTAFALVNAEDTYASYMLSDTVARKYFFSTQTNADFADIIETTLIGRFNASNVLAVYATAMLLGLSDEVVRPVLKNLKAPKGRMEMIRSASGVRGIVDYAHTPDALENVLKTLRETTHSGCVLTVVGCGGDRDKSKRPLMGNIAVSLSDHVIFTSDNPRSENPNDIITDIICGIPKKYGNYECVPNRAEAIRKACASALPGDILLVAGKGHETSQIYKDVENYFSDMEELKKYLL